MHPIARAAIACLVLPLAAAGTGAGGWCLGLGSLGPIRAGMSVEDVLRLADFPGMERRAPAEQCWYLHYLRGASNASDFDLMIVGGRVVRIELKGASTLHTLSGLRVGAREEQLMALYGARLQVQPHEYDPQGRVFTLHASSGDYGLRFATSSGRVTVIQSGPRQHLDYVEGCG